MNEEIESIEIMISDNDPEYMAGIIRIGTVHLFYTNNKTMIVDDYANKEFQSENELINFVAQEFNVSTDLVTIV